MTGGGLDTISEMTEQLNTIEQVSVAASSRVQELREGIISS